MCNFPLVFLTDVEEVIPCRNGTVRFAGPSAGSCDAAEVEVEAEVEMEVEVEAAVEMEMEVEVEVKGQRQWQ